MTISACDSSLKATSGATLANVCDVIRTPEKEARCVFLVPYPDASSTNTGGSGGTSSDAGSKDSSTGAGGSGG
jgi:hypothetical protein